MRRISKHMLIEKIIELHDFISDCEQAELKYYNHAVKDSMKNDHYIRGKVFQFVKEAISSHFRPLV